MALKRQVWDVRGLALSHLWQVGRLKCVCHFVTSASAFLASESEGRHTALFPFTFLVQTIAGACI